MTVAGAEHTHTRGNTSGKVTDRPPARPFDPPSVRAAGQPYDPAVDAPGSELLAPSRRKYDLHPPGLLYVVITVFLAIGAINSQNNLLFAAFGLSMAGFLISGVISGPPLMGIRARRMGVTLGHVGETAEIRYRLEKTRGRFAAMGLEIRELTDDSGRTPGGGEMISAGVESLRSGQSRTAGLTLRPARRGVHGLRGFSITTTFPFGIFRKTMVFEQPATWVVAPRRIALRDMPWHRSGREGATLSAVTSRRGRSTEFYALRGYVPGDPTRSIAWLPSARLGELVVLEHAASAPPKIWIRVDEPPDNMPGHLIERGAALVAALANDATQAGFAVGLAGRGIGSFRPLAGPRQVRAIQTAMAGLGANTDGSIDLDAPAARSASMLRVRVAYKGSSRGKAKTEFRLSAEEIDTWLGDRGSPPPEFMPSAGNRRGSGLIDRLRNPRRLLGLDTDHNAAGDQSGGTA